MMDIKELKNISVPYDSPIEVCLRSTIEDMSSAAAEWFDNGVMKAVTNAGFSIDKQKLVRILERDRQRYEEAYRNGYTDGYKKREDEIIRCRDCKHRFDGEHMANCCEELMIMTGWLTEIPVDPNGFCSKGERKEGDGDEV